MTVYLVPCSVLQHVTQHRQWYLQLLSNQPGERWLHWKVQHRFHWHSASDMPG